MNEMGLACMVCSCDSIIAALTCFVSLVGIFIANRHARITQKMTLLSKRVETFTIVEALVSSLAVANAKTQDKSPNSTVDFAIEWLEALQKNRAILDFCQSILGTRDIVDYSLPQLRLLLLPQLKDAGFIFSERRATDCVESIIQLLQFYAEEHTNVACRRKSFTKEMRASIESVINKWNDEKGNIAKEIYVWNVGGK